MLEKKRMKTINIFFYINYRKFLNDYLKTNGLTYYKFSKKVGINSSAFFFNIIKGKRNLTQKMLLKTAWAIGLNFDETEYFENLVDFRRVKNQHEKKFYLRKILNKIDIGFLLREYREGKNISQIQLSKKLKVSPRRISLIENHKTNIDYKTKKILLEKLGMSFKNKLRNLKLEKIKRTK